MAIRSGQLRRSFAPYRVAEVSGPTYIFSSNS